MSFNTDKQGRKMALIVEVDTSDFTSNCDIIRVAFEPIVYDQKKYFTRFRKNYSGEVNSSICQTRRKVSAGASASHNLTNNHIEYGDDHASAILKIILAGFEYIVVANDFAKKAIDRAMAGEYQGYKVIYLDAISKYFEPRMDCHSVAAMYYQHCPNHAHLDGYSVVGAPRKAATMTSIINGMCRAYCRSLDDLYNLSESTRAGTTIDYMKEISTRSSRKEL